MLYNIYKYDYSTVLSMITLTLLTTIDPVRTVLVPKNLVLFVSLFSYSRLHLPLTVFEDALSSLGDRPKEREVRRSN
jgi:hypothetical protein